MKLNNKAFTVVELLASFVLTMIIVTFLFEIVLELKGVYVNEAVKTRVLNKNAAIAIGLNNMLDGQTIAEKPSCNGTSCSIKFFSVTGAASTKSISISGKTVTVGNQKFEFPENTTFKDANIRTYNSSDSTAYAKKSYIKVYFKVKNKDLNKPVEFNYVYTY